MNKQSIIFILIFLILIISIVYFKKNTKEKFNIIRGNKYKYDSSDPNKYDFLTNKYNIIVGDYDDSTLRNLNKITTDNNVIHFKNNLYFKDSIRIGNNSADLKPTNLDLNTLKKIKNLPYIFDKQICLKDANDNSVSCVLPEHIEMINGKRGMIINTFPNFYPFTFYQDVNYGSRLYRVAFEKMDDVSKRTGGIFFKSVKIADGFRLKIFHEVNGTKGEGSGEFKEIKGEVPDITSFGEKWAEGIKSYWPETDFGEDNVGDKMCLSSYKFGPWQQKVGESQDTISNIFTGRPCVFTKDQEFLINKKKLYYENDTNGPSLHRHDSVHIHADLSVPTIATNLTTKAL